MPTNKKFPIYVLLDNIRSIYNVGSFFRTCDACNIEKLFLTGHTPHPPRKEITKTALGAENTVPFEYIQDPLTKIKELKKNHIQIISVETGKNTIPYTTYKPAFPICCIFGNEITGICQEILDLSDAIISIPMHGIKGSLNVVVSGGVILYDMVEKYLAKNSKS